MDAQAADTAVRQYIRHCADVLACGAGPGEMGRSPGVIQGALFVSVRLEEGQDAEEACVGAYVQTLEHIQSVHEMGVDEDTDPYGKCGATERNSVTE